MTTCGANGGGMGHISRVDGPSAGNPYGRPVDRPADQQHLQVIVTAVVSQHPIRLQEKIADFYAYDSKTKVVSGVQYGMNELYDHEALH